jgi:hypothetical protein
MSQLKKKFKVGKRRLWCQTGAVLTLSNVQVEQGLVLSDSSQSADGDNPIQALANAI